MTCLQIVLGHLHVDDDGRAARRTVAGLCLGLHIKGHRIIQRPRSVGRIGCGRQRSQCSGCSRICIITPLGDFRVAIGQYRTVSRFNHRVRFRIIALIDNRITRELSCTFGNKRSTNSIIASIDRAFSRHIRVNHTIPCDILMVIGGKIKSGVKNHSIYLSGSERVIYQFRNFLIVETGMNHHLVGRNRYIQIVLHDHPNMLVIQGAMGWIRRRLRHLRMIHTDGLHIINWNIRHMHINLMFLTTALQVCDTDGEIQTLAVRRTPSARQSSRITILVLHTSRYRRGLELGIHRRSGNGGTAVVAGTAIIVAVGLRQQHQVTRGVVERRGQVEVMPARVTEEHHVVHHQCGVQNLIVPIIRIVRQRVQRSFLQIQLDWNAVRTGGFGRHI